MPLPKNNFGHSCIYNFMNGEEDVYVRFINLRFCKDLVDAQKGRKGERKGYTSYKSGGG
jgi:hypothetical protein